MHIYGESTTPATVWRDHKGVKMATVRIPGGRRGIELAKLIVQHNPDSHWQEAGAVIQVDGSRLQIDRWMVVQAYWPDSPPDTATVNRFMRHFVRTDPKQLRVVSDECIIVGEESESEQPLLVRFPATLKTRLAAMAQALTMSQNEIVVRAVEDFVSFGEEITRDEAAHRRRQHAPHQRPLMGGMLKEGDNVPGESDAVD